MRKQPRTQDVLPGMPGMPPAAVDGVSAAPASREPPRAGAAPRLKPVNRSQMLFRTVDVERVEENLGRKPGQVVADGGFTSRENILTMDEQGVDLVGSLDEHDAQSAGQMKRRGVAEAFYPRAFIDKMKTDAAKAVYRLRGAVAEFPNAWIKAKIGLRQFRVRGLRKVRCETLWAVLTHNIQHWIRLCWRRPQAAAAD